MQNIQIRRKIKGQKIGAICLIFFPILLLMSYFSKSNFEMLSLNDYLLVGSLITLMICGLFGLKTSIRKETELNKK